MTEFQEKLRQQHEKSIHKELENLLSTCKGAEAEVSRKDFEGFKQLFHRFLQVKGPSVEWPKINRPPEDLIQRYEKIQSKPLPQGVAASLNKLAVVKLNGGLGTSMGCKGPKSLISVRNENTFLDLTVQQIEHLNKTYNADVPLVLMNSFNTDEDTKKILQKYTHHRVKIHTFNQSRYPRINKESLLPVATNMGLTGENMEAWYPPGHGDIYTSFYNSGLLDQLISEGKEYIFVSNIDNLGATVDLHILNHLMSQPADKRCEFVMEVTDKTRADVKGGTLIQYDNKLMLLEIAQVPKAHVDEFKSVTKFKIFNTNNLWISLPAIKRLHEQNAMDLEIIINPKGGTLIQYDNKLMLLEIAQVPKAHVDEFKSVTKFKIFNTNNLWISLPAIKRLHEQNAMDLEIIINPKTLDGGLNVIQLETAVGAAIKSFDNALGINVPRSRFLPVKTTSDLLLVMSNLYSLDAGSLTMSAKREFPTTPHIKLGSSFTKVQDFLRRFESIPDMLELDHLTVSGDVTFGKQVTLKGTVIIIANHGDRIDIPAGAMLENKIVSGNLRILDH
ncbi:UDP-glucose pyrophosphorylase 2a [Silurus asotus]|uniref:UTP--glucose-1-phosphate uridylyltransferase n=1 Tax=Silurus asotus TaxID=30991 RepID=A0AAD5AZL8_SILAS|nr:UDP-glucose pyrophosphorylase 2a [Silurus asotus]